MSKTMKIVVVLVLSSIVIASQSPQAIDKAAITKAVLAVDQAMSDADSRLDIDGLFAHIADVNDVVIQDGRLFNSRQQAYNIVKGGFQRVAGLERTVKSRRVKVLAADMALLIGKGQVKTTLDDGRVFDSAYAVSALYQCIDGKWKLIHGHYSAPNQ